MRRHSVPWHKRKFSFKKLRVSQHKAPSRELLEVESPVMDAPPPTPEDQLVEDGAEAVEEEAAAVASTSDSPEPSEAPSTPPVAPPRTKRRSEAQRPQTLALETEAVLMRKTSLPAPAHIKVVDLRRDEDEGGWERVFKKLSKRSGMFPFAYLTKTNHSLVVLGFCGGLCSSD